MPRPSNPQTPEAKALTNAIESSGTTKAAIADALDVTPGMVSQYASGHRPVPWDRAESIAAMVRIDPATISAEFGRIRERFGRSQPERLDAPIIARAIQLMRDSTEKLEGEPVDVEADPELFAEMLQLAVLEQAESGHGERRTGKAGRQGGGAAGTASQETDGDAARAAAGRARKRA